MWTDFTNIYFQTSWPVFVKQHIYLPSRIRQLFVRLSGYDQN